MVAPTLAVIGFAIWVGIATGAMMSAQSWAAAQARDPDLVVFPPYIKYWAPLKLARIAELQPDVIFIGTSRCQEFRSAMLRPYRAYNACLSAWTLDQNIELLRRVFLVSRPKIVIIALDYFLFTDVWEDGYRIERAGDFEPSYHAKLHGIQDTFAAFWMHPQQTFDIARRALVAPQYEPRDHDRLLGIEAIRYGTGFRYDGSLLFPSGEIEQTTAGANARDIKAFAQAFPGGTGVSPRQLERLKVLSALARENGASLVGIQLPFAEGALDYLDTDKGYGPYAGLWQDFENPRMRDAMAELGIHYFDSARDPVSKDYRYFVDPAHLGEAGTLCVLAHLAGDRDFSTIFPDLDVGVMLRACASATENREFFDLYHNDF